MRFFWKSDDQEPNSDRDQVFRKFDLAFQRLDEHKEQLQMLSDRILGNVGNTGNTGTSENPGTSGNAGTSGNSGNAGNTGSSEILRKLGNLLSRRNLKNPRKTGQDLELQEMAEEAATKEPLLD